MKTILVPTDFSDYALYALKVAASLAKKMNAIIKLIHVCKTPSYGFAEDVNYEREYNKTIITQAKNKLNTLAAQDFLNGIQVTTKCITNMHIWEVVSDDKYRDVDLIVMGSHGSSGLSKLFIGSNTEKVVRLAESPVLTIKNEIADFSIKKIVFASNFYEESYSVFEKIKSYANLYRAQINLLKVITPKDFEPTPVSQKLMEDFAKKFELSDYIINIYNDLSIEKGITDFCDKINADLIAIETHGRTGIAHLINGSLAEDVANHIDRPILSIKMEGASSDPSLKGSFNKIYENWGAE